MAEPERICSRCGGSYSAEVIFCPKDGTPLGARKTELSEDPYVGLNVAGQFEIRQLIGIGAMGRVYRAHQFGIDRDVAMKILHRDLLRNETVIARFHREAKVASRLTHPNVVQVLMTGELAPSTADVGGEAYLVMEFLDGISLRSALAATGGAMPLPRALHVIVQVADAVGEAHAQGIVHRDIKPENVMLVKRGEDADFAKVLDFGVARSDFGDNSLATQAGAIFGTARYISPEGARGQQVGTAGDVYSLATILFQCLSGETPFDGDNPVSILLKHTNEEPPDVRSKPHSSYVPEPIARLIAQNLGKDPAARSKDGREFARALLEAARTTGIHPDDLIGRSSLLASGTAGSPGIERTKSLTLSAELAARLGGAPPTGEASVSDDGDRRQSAVDDAGPSKTQVTDSSGESHAEANRAPVTSTRVIEPSQVSAPRMVTRVLSGPDTRPSDPGPGRISRVEATIADTSADQLLTAGSGTAAGGDARHSSPSGFGAAVPPRPSPPDAWPSPEAEPAPWRRRLLIGICFVAGVALTLLLAVRLGAFTTPKSELEEYVERSRKALQARAYAAPPGENVRDLTRAALERWPHAPEILEIRRIAAREVVADARDSASGDRSGAQRLTDLALELDPHSAEARDLQNSLVAPVKTAAPTPLPAPVATQERPRAMPPKVKSKPAVTPSSEPAAKPSADAPPAPDPAPTVTAGGRWL